MNKKSENLIFGIGAAVLFVFVIWFFILYESVNYDTSKKPNISESIQNSTGMIIDYNYDIKIPSISYHKMKDQTVHAIIDAGGIVTAIIGGSVSMVLSKLLNRYWPDKKLKT
jgi:hypothetical protein